MRLELSEERKGRTNELRERELQAEEQEKSRPSSVWNRSFALMNRTHRETGDNDLEA